jgi:hypothetical protein
LHFSDIRVSEHTIGIALELEIKGKDDAPDVRPQSNKKNVQALKHRCRRVDTKIQPKQVIEVAASTKASPQVAGRRACEQEDA